MSFNLKEKKARTIIEAKAQNIEKRLEESLADFTELEGTEEANLESARLNKDPDFTIGKGVSTKHVGTKEAVTEAKLNTEKSLFSEHRKNVSGDVPKLEEKRLANKPVEKEKYEKANS